MKTRKSTLKEIKRIYKRGYIPSRGTQEYTLDGANDVGSFEHAVMNFTNEQLEKISPIQAREEGFIAEPRKSGAAWQRTEANFINYTRNMGLDIEECEENAEVNPAYQWKIAFFRKISECKMLDIMFALQEEDGSWTIKFRNDLLKYQKLPQYIQPTKMDYLMDTHYSRFRTYVITNPTAKKKYEKEQKKLNAEERKEK